MPTLNLKWNHEFSDRLFYYHLTTSVAKAGNYGAGRLFFDESDRRGILSALI
jgi:hypothetical protein